LWNSMEGELRSIGLVCIGSVIESGFTLISIRRFEIAG
jgi:hypothetical protein